MSEEEEGAEGQICGASVAEQRRQIYPKIIDWFYVGDCYVIDNRLKDLPSCCVESEKMGRERRNWDIS